MRIVAALICTAIATLPAAAQDQQGRSLMERGMQQFFDGLGQELEPALRDLQGLAREFGPPMQRFLSEMGPALSEILAGVEDWTKYEVPELLPNGDIIIRRKREVDPDPQELPPTGPTDL